MRRPIAYLRKSRVTNDRHVSWDVQLRAVQALAGDPTIEVLSDWNRSGRGAERRPEYRRLLEMIDAGEVSTVYSYSLSRLSRSVADFAKLVDLCSKRGTAIRLEVESFLDFGSASGRLMVSILSAFAQMEADIASERSTATIKVRRDRGDKIGGQYFKQPDLVIDAFKRAGSFAGAAKLLSHASVATRNGNSVWHPTAVRDVLEHAAPDLIPPKLARTQGAKAAAPFLLYRLIKCPCGRTMTAVRDRAKRVRYGCLIGRLTPGHGPTYVSETRLLGWAKAEAARLEVPAEITQLVEDAADRRVALVTDRRLLGISLRGQSITEDEYTAANAAIQTQLDELDSKGRVHHIDPLSDADWDRPAEEVNHLLRQVWHQIELEARDGRLYPVRALWVEEAWRRSDEAQRTWLATRAA